jgi:predicted ATPase
MTDDIIARLRSRSPYLDGSSAEHIMDEAADEIEHLREHAGAWRLVATSHEPEVLRLQGEVERLRAALEKIEEETERTCQQCRLIEIIARAALEPKP